MPKFYKCSPVKTKPDFDRMLSQLKLTQEEFGLQLRDVKNAYFQFEEDRSLSPIERGNYYLTERFINVNPDGIKITMVPAVYVTGGQFYLNVT